MGNQSSLLEFWKRILHLRNDYKDLFIYGRYRLLEIEDEDLLAFVKENENIKSLTIVNMSARTRKWDGTAGSLGPRYEVLIGNVEHAEENVLKPREGRGVS
jgi:oligo-1,6-glucosidase